MTNMNPTDPKRVRNFALFFKNYMSVSTLVVAALPVPVTSLHLIPTFAVQTKLLSVYTSLFCFLLLGFIFYLRHGLARTMFPEFFGRRAVHVVGRLYPWRPPIDRAKIVLINILPLIFIASSLVLVFQYNDVLKKEVNSVRWCNELLNLYGPKRVVRDLNNGTCNGPLPTTEGQTQDVPTDRYPVSFNEILARTDLNEIPFPSRLMILYVGIFLTAETAFILMAIKEYLQDLVGLTDLDLIRLRHSAPHRADDGATIPVTQATPQFAQPESEGADV